MASPCLKIIWSPDASDANQYVSPQFRDISTITSLNYRQPRLTGVFVTGCDDLTSITVPNCTTIEGYGNADFLSIEAIQICCCNSLTNIDFAALNYLRGGFWLTNLQAITSITFPALTELDVRIPSGGDGSATLRNCNLLASVSFPALTTVTSTSVPTSNWKILIYNNPLLTDISIPNLVFPNGAGFYFAQNALSQACVDAILAQAVASAGFVTGTLDLSLGTNAAPSVAGAADKATLIGRGVTVSTN